MARLLRLLIALTTSLVLTLLFLTGCTLLGLGPKPDPLAEYRPALRPDFELTPEQIAALQQYSISVKIDPANDAYTGTVELTLPVTGTAPLRELYFRLYPNLLQFGGSMEVSGARVNDTTVNYSYEAEHTAIHLSLPQPLELGSTARVWLSFSGVFPERKPGFYTIFGSSDGVLSLTNFYPILAGRRGEAWALDVASPQGDVGFHDSALYRVEVMAPADEVIAAPGAVITRTTTADGWATSRHVLGPAREFTLMLSPRFQVEEAEALGTRVRSYFMPEDATNARSALYDAVMALQIYSDQFGPYPYREMAVVQAPLTFRGMEFPGMNLIGSQTYNVHVKDLENLVVHEVAHQWWYNQIGSDQPMQPWLDEGLAEFSMYFYYAGRYGEPIAQRLRKTRWEIPTAGLVARGVDAPIGRAVKDYDQDTYETIVYGKGALFFATLRDEIGPEAFQKLLRTYLERYCWKIATPADFQALAEEVSGKNLEALFGKWVKGTE
jgi:hypothetical protein